MTAAADGSHCRRHRIRRPPPPFVAVALATMQPAVHRRSRRRSPLKIETVMPRSTQKLGGKALEELLLPSCSRRDKYSRSLPEGIGTWGLGPTIFWQPPEPYFNYGGGGADYVPTKF